MTGTMASKDAGPPSRAEEAVSGPAQSVASPGSMVWEVRTFWQQYIDAHDNKSGWHSLRFAIAEVAGFDSNA